MICFRCGILIDDDATRCANCGTELTDEKRTMAVAESSLLEIDDASVDHLPYFVGEVLLSRYELIDVLSHDQTRTVYHAEDRVKQSEVAVVVMPSTVFETPKERTAHLAQLKNLLTFRHANIVSVVDVSEHGENLVLVHDLLIGITLETLLTQRKKRGEVFDFREITPIAEQILDGLAYLHAKNTTIELDPSQITILPNSLKLTGHLADKNARANVPIPLQGLSAEEANVYRLTRLLGEMLTGTTLASDADLRQHVPNLPDDLADLFADVMAKKTVKRYGIKSFSKTLHQLSVAALKRRTSPPKDSSKANSAIQGRVAIPLDPLPTPIEPLNTLIEKPPPAQVNIAPASGTESGEPGVSRTLIAIISVLIVSVIALGAFLLVNNLKTQPKRTAAPPTQQEVKIQLRTPSTPKKATVALVGRSDVQLDVLSDSTESDGRRPVPDRLTTRDLLTRKDAAETEISASDVADIVAPRPDTSDVTVDLNTTTPSSTGDIISTDHGHPSAPDVATADIGTDTSPVLTVAKLKAKTCPRGMRRIIIKARGGKPASGYCIARCEYPGCGSTPRTSVNLAAASRLCKKRRARLCTVREWRRGCGGVYPYGSTYDANRCNTLDANFAPRPIARSGSFRRCRSPYGLYDMSGNVSEWTRSAHVMGGRSSRDGKNTAKCGSRSRRNPGSSHATVGFRCCAELEDKR